MPFRNTKGQKMNKKKVEAACAVIEDNGKFLITKRMETSPMGHCWEFPGGKIEPGETVEECIVRECREEINVTVEPLRRLQEEHYDYPHGFIHLYFILCRITSGELKALECREFRWIAPTQFAEFEFPPADRNVIEGLIAGRI